MREKIDTDYKRRAWKILARLFKMRKPWLDFFTHIHLNHIILTEITWSLCVNSLHKFKKTVHWDKSASFGRRQIIVKSSWPFEELSSSLGCIFRLKADSAGAEFARWQHRFHQQRSLLQYSSRFFPSLLRYLLFLGSTKTFLSFCCTIP